jgi:hypothetical protein
MGGLLLASNRSGIASCLIFERADSRGKIPLAFSKTYALISIRPCHFTNFRSLFMRANSRYLLAIIAACGLSGFSRLSVAQDEQGTEATAETPEPAQEEVAPPAESTPVDGEEMQQQNDNSGTGNTMSGKMDDHAAMGKGNHTTAAMTDVQEALNRAGAGLKVDGKFGKSTKIALKKFQKKNKLKVTGGLDEPTKEKLGLAR